MKESALRRGLRRPLVQHAALAVLFVALGTVVLRRYLPESAWSWLAAWLIAVNLTVFAYYGIDKWLARNEARRIPEGVLHGLAFAGGSPGAFLAMRAFRHKSVKWQFRRVFWVIVVLQAGLLVWLAYHLWHTT